jgi:hypothetical protein
VLRGGSRLDRRQALAGTIAGGVPENEQNEVLEVVTAFDESSVAICTGYPDRSESRLDGAPLCRARRRRGRHVRLRAVLARGSPESRSAGDGLPTARRARARSITAGASPSLGEGSDLCGYDLALITLSENVPREVAVPAVPRIDGQPASPASPMSPSASAQDAEGRHTGGRMRLDGLAVECAGSRCGARLMIQDTEFMGQSGVCSGDSGGTRRWTRSAASSACSRVAPIPVRRRCTRPSPGFEISS